MNRGCGWDFHFAIESSSQVAVNWVWKLWMSRKKSKIGAELQYGLRSEAERFPTSRVEREVGGNGRVEKVFHLSAVPTVTAGFIGFAFDIRE